MPKFSWTTNQKSRAWFSPTRYSLNRPGPAILAIKFSAWSACYQPVPTISMITTSTMTTTPTVSICYKVRSKPFSACVDVQQAHQATFKSFHQENMRELINSVEKRTWINLGTCFHISKLKYSFCPIMIMVTCSKNMARLTIFFHN